MELARCGTSKCTISRSVRLPFICLSLGGFLSLFTSFDTSCQTKWWIELFSPQRTPFLFANGWMPSAMPSLHHVQHIVLFNLHQHSCTKAYSRTHTHDIDVRIFAIKRLDSILFSVWRVSLIFHDICYRQMVVLQHFSENIDMHVRLRDRARVERMLCCSCWCMRTTFHIYIIVSSELEFHLLSHLSNAKVNVPQCITISCDCFKNCVWFQYINTNISLQLRHKIFSRICEWQVSTLMISLSIFGTRFDQSYSSYLMLEFVFALRSSA